MKFSSLVIEELDNPKSDLYGFAVDLGSTTISCNLVRLKDGKVMLEFRTTKDPTMRLGKKISLSERISTHYRRFIDVDQFDREISWKGSEDPFIACSTW